MNKRCIVNVATGEFYCKMQDRLKKSFLRSVDSVKTNGAYFMNEEVMPETIVGKGIDLILWRDCFPPGSRTHNESPYGFKVFAIKAAYAMGYTSILWLDSPGYAVKEDISPIFEKIEKEGYYAMSHIDPLENYLGDRALSVFNLSKNDTRLSGLNLPSGSCYGFDLSKPFIKKLFQEFIIGEEGSLFKDNPPHRHDETILALLLRLFDLPVFTFDPLFQSDSPECVIKSGEMK